MIYEPLQEHVAFVQELGDTIENRVARRDGSLQAVSRIAVFPFSVLMRMFNRVLRLMGLHQAKREVVAFPGRPFVSLRKRSHWFHRMLVSILPHWLTSVLGYTTSNSLGLYLSQEVRLSPSKPGGKGNKRKIDVMEEEDSHVWMQLLDQDLPEESADVDPDYEPFSEETASEEYATEPDSRETSVEESNSRETTVEEPSTETDAAEDKVCIVIDGVESIGDQS